MLTFINQEQKSWEILIYRYANDKFISILQLIIYLIEPIMDQDSQSFSLTQENLIPFYIIEDRIKQNFNKIEKNVKRQWQTNHSIDHQLTKINQDHTKYKQQINQKFLDLQKKIVTQINAQLQGRIIVAINKNMAAFTTRMEQKQKEIDGVNEGIAQKLDGMKKVIVYDISKENQKFFGKETQKLQKKMKATVEQMLKKVTPTKQSNSNLRPSSRQREQNLPQKNIIYEQPQAPQTYFNEQWVLKIKQMQGKILKFQQFSVNLDKRFYQNMTSLKESWKELGEEMLDTKRKLTAKQDELRLQLIKVKGIKQFQGSPQDYEQTFKIKLMNKFTQIYQTISNLCSKTDMESSIQKIKKTLIRHDGEITDVREEMAKNSDYFTFYMNNSNQQDLSSKIKEINDKIIDKQLHSNQRFKKQLQKNQILQTELSKLDVLVTHINLKNAKLQKNYSQMRQQLFKQIERIDVLQDHNSFSPQKMAKIHNTLDVGFTPSQQELIAKKAHTNTQNTAIKQLKGEMNKLKDELFVINHQFAEIQKIKKNMTGIETKIDKIKIESEQAILSRKPWVCLSCDKQKQQADKMKKEMSKKKLAENRGGLFHKQKSDKLIKLIPSPEEKFQVYQKYREKYLSDTVRLPDIYKEKIGDKQP